MKIKSVSREKECWILVSSWRPSYFWVWWSDLEIMPGICTWRGKGSGELGRGEWGIARLSEQRSPLVSIIMKICIKFGRFPLIPKRNEFDILVTFFKVKVIFRDDRKWLVCTWCIHRHFNGLVARQVRQEVLWGASGAQGESGRRLLLVHLQSNAHCY